jgi:hypothetical protein
MAGAKLAGAPMATPFLKSNGGQIRDQTPIMPRFQVDKSGSKPGVVTKFGITFNKPNFAGAAGD